MAKRKSSSRKSSSKGSAPAGTLEEKGVAGDNVTEAADGSRGPDGKPGVTYKDNPDKADPSSVSQIEEVETPVGA